MQIQQLRYVLILLCSSVLSVNVYSDTESSAVTNTQHFLQDLSQKNPGYKFNFSLPVNVYDKNRILYWQDEDKINESIEHFL